MKHHLCIFASILFFSLLAVPNGIAQWVSLNGPTTSPVNCFSIADGGSTIIAGTSAGVFVGGSGSWTSINRNLSSPLVGVMDATANDIFIGTLDGSVLSSFNAGNWTDITPHSGIAAILALTVVQSNLYVGTDGAFWWSTDNGAHWSQPAPPNPLNVVSRIAGAGSNLFIVNHGVYRTQDNGTSWGNASAGLPTNILTLTATNTKVFAGTDQGIYVSTNNGTTWSPINQGMTSMSVTSVATDGGSNIYAGTQANGVYYSGDNGASWQAGNTGLPTMKINTLQIAGASLIVGTAANGVWLRPLSEFTAGSGVNDLAHSDPEISIFPNPSSGIVTIHSTPETISRITIRNILGQVVADISKPTVGESSIDLSKVPAGVYVATVVSPNSVVTKKIVRQ